jgi:hypothetical protein
MPPVPDRSGEDGIGGREYATGTVRLFSSSVKYPEAIDWQWKLLGLL